MAESHREEIAKLEALYASNPGGRVFVHLAEAYRRTGEHERARRILEDGLSRHADSVSGYVVLGRVLTDLDETTAAESAFRRVIELDEGNLIALRSLGDIARAAERFDEAADFYSEALSRNPSDGEVRALLGSVQRDQAAESRIAEQPSEASTDEDGAGGPHDPEWNVAPEWGSIESRTDEPVAPPSVAPGQIDEPGASVTEIEFGLVELDALPGDLAALPGDLSSLAGDDAGREDAASEADADVVTDLESIDWVVTESAEEGIETDLDELPDSIHADLGADDLTVAPLDITPWTAAPTAGVDASEPEEDAAPTESFEVEAGFDAPAAESEFEAGFDAPAAESEVEAGFEAPAAEPDVEFEFEAPAAEFEAPAAEFEVETGFESPAADSEVEAGFEAPAADSEVEAGFEAPVADSGFDAGFEAPAADSEFDAEFEAPAAEFEADGELEAPAAEFEVEGEFTAPMAEADVVDSRMEEQSEIRAAAEGSGESSDGFEHDFGPFDEVPADSQVYDAYTATGFESLPAGAAPMERPAEVQPDDVELNTETIAELYRSQGFHDRAADIYRALLQQRPDDERLAARLREIEQTAEPAVRAERVEWSGEAQAGEAAADEESGESWLHGAGAVWVQQDASAEAETPYSWTGGGDEEASSPPIRRYLQDLIAWRGVAGSTRSASDAAPAFPWDDSAFGGAGGAADTRPDDRTAAQADADEAGGDEPWAGMSGTGAGPDAMESTADAPDAAGAGPSAQWADATPGGITGPQPGGRDTPSTGDPVEDAFLDWYGGAPDSEPSEERVEEPSSAASAPDDFEEEADDEDLEMFRTWLKSLKK